VLTYPWYVRNGGTCPGMLPVGDERATGHTPFLRRGKRFSVPDNGRTRAPFSLLPPPPPYHAARVRRETRVTAARAA